MSDSNPGESALTDSATGTEAENVVDDTTNATDAGSEGSDTPANDAAAEVHQGGVPTMTAPQQDEQPSGAKATKAARKAHLTVSRVEPWSVMKFSFVVSLVCFIVLFVAVAVVYTILSALGVFDALTELITSLTEGEDDEIQINPGTWFSPARVLGYTGLVGALNIILITALATVGSMLYNLAADLVGGVDVTLNESE